MQKEKGSEHTTKRSDGKKIFVFAAVAVVFIGVAVAAFIWMNNGQGGQKSGQLTPVTNFSHIHGLAVDPTKPNVLYVGTHLGLVRGENDTNWNWVGDYRADFMGFTMHPKGKVFYVSGHKVPDAPFMGVARSSDGGFTWEIIALKGKVDFHTMTISQANPEVLYGWYYRDGKFYKSTDGGRSWQNPRAQGLSNNVVVLATDPVDEKTLWAATQQGLYRSVDGGESFQLKSFRDETVIAIAIDPTNAQILYASIQSGLRKSTDSGQSWQPIGGDMADVVDHLAIDPTDAKIIYAAGESAIYKSTDSGASWKLAKPAERGH